MNLYVGTSGYGYKEWKGKFYPKGLPADQMLHYYGEHFRAVEINHTFRMMPQPAALEAWMADVPADFQFALKAPQQITHRKRLKDAQDPVARFIEVAGVLKTQLGPLLFQLPPNLKKDLPRLSDFLDLLPKGTRAAFEFRHQTWFEQDVFDLLHKHNAALCIADADDDLKIPFVATADWGYLRLRRTEYGPEAMKQWMAQLQQQSWNDAYVFFRHEDEATGPRFAKDFMGLLP